MPGIDNRPGVGNRPGIDNRPGVGNRPGIDNRPGIGNRPGIDNRPGIGNRPGIDNRPGIGNRPGIDNRPGIGNRPGIDNRPGGGDYVNRPVDPGYGARPPAYNGWRGAYSDGNSVHALYGDWTVTEGGKHGYFDFERKGGSGDNLPFDGTTQTMGTATWSSGKVPTKQIILCHINDPGNSPADSFVRCLETGGEGIDPTASKTATPAFNRTYKWSIEKAVDKTEVKTAGGPASFKYTVSVKHDAGSDSGWKVSGAISVSNTNSAAVSGVEVYGRDQRSEREL